MPTSEYFVQVESPIRELLRSVPHFSSVEQDEVVSFLEAGEYGLAVETAYHISIEENKPISQQSYELFRKLVLMMEIESSVNLNRLAAQVSSPDCAP